MWFSRAAPSDPPRARAPLSRAARFVSDARYAPSVVELGALCDDDAVVARLVDDDGGAREFAMMEEAYEAAATIEHCRGEPRGGAKIN